MSAPNSLDRRTPPPAQEFSSSEQPASQPTGTQALLPGREGRKERRNPSITPRKFNRFFTPRSLRSSPYSSSSRRALYEINDSRNSRGTTQSSPIRAPRPIFGQENTPTTFPRDLKRRKLFHTPDSSPEQAHLEEKQGQNGFRAIQDIEPREEQDIPSSPCERVARDLNVIQEEIPQEPLERIVQAEERSLNAQLLELSIDAPPRPSRQYVSYPRTDWRDETSLFCSKPSDVHVTTSLERPHGRVIPFCATSCNTNSLVAIGDEEGRVRLLESNQQSKPPFADVYLGFRVHTNAIIDMVFSEDDSLLATASGDQTARVVDMTTQSTFSILAHHSASLKQVRFMPGSNSILATSSRDGGVKIWDLRCKGDDGPRHHFYAHVPNGLQNTRRTARKPTWGRPIHSIADAHRLLYPSRLSQVDPTTDVPSRTELEGRAGYISVTAISFLPQGQENLLLTASEGDASVKLWDIRAIHSKRKVHVALSQTKQPESHNQWRHFGIGSINLNGDGTRLYTLCKDNTVYTYSTAHLILGHAPELSVDNPGGRFAPRESKEGLGPMYGFRHPQFHATSFYVKSAVRKAKDGKSELLAVGSSNGTAVLFPTDERYLETQKSSSHAHGQQEVGTRSSVLGNWDSPKVNSVPDKLMDGILRSTNGTALVRGHDREVGSLCWAYDGELITVGDDLNTRCWRENLEEARDLRMCGESGGRRFACGWAEVEEDYDDDDY